MKTVVRTFECATCLIDERVRTEWLPEVLMKRPDGCKLEQFKTSRHRGRSGRMMLGQLSVQMEYHVVRMDARDPISLTWNLCRIF
jgi:hypothetical protein